MVEAKLMRDAHKVDLTDSGETNLHTHAESSITNLVSDLASKAPLDTGQKVPTINLGGSGADNTKYLRGDQTWQSIQGGSGLSHPQVMARLAMVM